MNLLRPVSVRSIPGSCVFRRYATRKDPQLPSLDTTHRLGRPSGSVGPFQLGVSQTPFGKDEPVKKWSELSAGGKVRRTTERTTNLTVILVGAGLSVVLIYCLASELFSKNSPTVLHSNACERIKSSPQVAKYLHGPLVFHNNPPSAVRPRHRNHTVNSQVVIDSNGREHLILNFYIQGRSPGSEPFDSSSYYDTATQWVESLSDLTWDEIVAWSTDRAHHTWQESKRIFKYLVGSLPSPPSPTEPLSSPSENTRPPEKTGFLGMFSTLRGLKAGGSTSRTTTSDGQTFTEAEVHADLVRNPEGYFVYRYLLLDLPSSRTRQSRVFVERAPGVRTDEPVTRWNS